ncbi:family 16 glycosylhydrolase [Streptomyces sp. NPDC007861]|uniref:glycoside hydrolase family 16 protein n=1 Tax=Streptomyces sp. NPDC007861 TaxID=3154893 RepID=UPI0033C02A21
MERRAQEVQSSDQSVPRRRLLTGGAALAGAALLGTAGRADAATYETVLINSFASTAALEANWNYLYPWGSDHNGTARMYRDRITVSGGVLSLTATRLSSPEGTSAKPPNLPINYHSGAIHAKHQITVNSTYPYYEVGGNFQAPTSTGCWPAFWLTGVQWPPEADILEYMGTNENAFVTWQLDGSHNFRKVPVSSPGSWHNYYATLRKINDTDLSIEYFLDDVRYATHTAPGWVGRPMWLIINLQMEAGSGSPGPSSATYRANGVWIGRNKA